MSTFSILNQHPDRPVRDDAAQFLAGLLPTTGPDAEPDVAAAIAQEAALRDEWAALHGTAEEARILARCLLEAAAPVQGNAWGEIPEQAYNLLLRDITIAICRHAPQPAIASWAVTLEPDLLTFDGWLAVRCPAPARQN